MTARQRHPREQPELDGYGELIARARAEVSSLPTETLVRIRALLERALAGPEPGVEDLEALAQAVDGGA